MILADVIAPGLGGLGVSFGQLFTRLAEACCSVGENPPDPKKDRSDLYNKIKKLDAELEVLKSELRAEDADREPAENSAPPTT